MVDVKPDPLAQNAAALKAAGASVEDHVLSITDRDAVSRLIGSLTRLDVLVNNAGGSSGTESSTRSQKDDFRKMYDVNVVRGVRGDAGGREGEEARRAHNKWAPRAAYSRRGPPRYAHAKPYITSKAGTVGLTRSMAIDLAPRGIFVNAVAPGLIETEMFRSLTQERQEELIAKQPTKELGQPADIANGICFFADRRSRNVTGQILTMDGGRSMGISIY